MKHKELFNNTQNRVASRLCQDSQNGGCSCSCCCFTTLQLMSKALSQRRHTVTMKLNRKEISAFDEAPACKCCFESSSDCAPCRWVEAVTEESLVWVAAVNKPRQRRGNLADGATG